MSEFAFPATYTDSGFIKSVIAFNVNAENPVFSADSTNPNFENILAGLRSGDSNVWQLFNLKDAVMRRFQQVSERYAFDGENVLFDGDPVHNTFTDLLVRALEDGDADNYTALARFGENLAANPQSHSREQAYDWLSCHKFQITENGDVVGYKGLVKTDDPDVYTSSFKSEVRGKPSGFVNGAPVPELSRIPQKVGDVVTMPRSEVVHDPRQACKRGLHVATRGYATGYGGALGMVFVNPRDIVSVPTDGGGEKVRACRYMLAAIIGENEQVPANPVLSERTGYTWAGDVGYKV